MSNPDPTAMLFKTDYEVDIDDVLKEMSWNEEKENNNLALYVVVSIPKGSPDKMTANLIGPILINNKTGQAVQMVISNSPYSHKFPLIGESQSQEPMTSPPMDIEPTYGADYLTHL